MDAIPAYRIAAGQFVIAELKATRTICLKVERVGKDHVNHFLVPLDPLPERQHLALQYLDPEQPLLTAQGFSFAFEPTPTHDDIAVGDAFDVDGTIWLKLLDAPSSQRLYCYVEVANGQVRPRMERPRHQLLNWRIERI